MPAFIPATPATPGTFQPQTLPGTLIDSTYDDLGGTYDSISYVYDGLQISYRPATGASTGAFVPA